MKETEEKIVSIAEQKRRIRERYKGVDPDSLDVILALLCAQENNHRTRFGRGDDRCPFPVRKVRFRTTEKTLREDTFFREKNGKCYISKDE